MLEPKYLQRLQQNSWFAQLATVFKDLIIQPAIQPSEAKQELIFHLGNIFDGLYAGLAGAVRLGYIDIEGNQSVVAMVEPILCGLVKSHWSMLSHARMMPPVLPKV